MPRLRFGSLVGLTGSLVVALSACDGVTAPTTGYLEITVVGFPTLLGFRSPRLSVNVGGENHQFTNYQPPHLILGEIAPGDYSVTLEGLPPGVPTECTDPEGTERTVSIAAAGRYFIRFSLSCTPGTLEVTTTTTGIDPDPDGYSVELTRVCDNYYYYYYDYGTDCGSVIHIAVPSNGAVISTIAADLTGSGYAASLLDVAGNCVQPDALSFAYPATASIEFVIVCSAISPSRTERRSATTSRPGG